MHICIMVKVISLSDDAYNKLKMQKKEGESFSDVVNRFVETERGKSFLDLAGVWKGDKEIDKIFKRVIEDRKEAKFRF